MMSCACITEQHIAFEQRIACHGYMRRYTHPSNLQQGPLCTHPRTYNKCLLVTLVQASVETLREQVKLLRSQRQRAVVLAHLPALRPQAQAPAHGKGPSQACAALDLTRRLQLEPAQTPKVGSAAASHPYVPS